MTAPDMTNAEIEALLAGAAKGEVRSHDQMVAEELHLMKTGGVIEVMVRNPSVSEYIGQLEAERDALRFTIEQLQGPLTVAALTARADAAEAELAKVKAGRDALREALISILHHEQGYAPELRAIASAALHADALQSTTPTKEEQSDG